MGNAKVIRELRQMQGATRRQTNTLEETDMQTETNTAAVATAVECFKPLIFDFFTDAYDIAKQYTCKEQPSQHEHKEQCVKVEDNMTHKEKNGERTRYKFEPFALCSLTPSCNIPEEFRHYEENGHLNESESLFKKHSQESKFLLHVLPFIIEKLVKAHSLYAELVKLQHENYETVNTKVNGVNSKREKNASSGMSDSCDLLLHNVEKLNNSCFTEHNMYNNHENEEDCDDNVLQGSVIYSAEPNVSALSEEHQEVNNVISDECNRSSHNSALNSNDTTVSHNKTRRFHHIECLSSSDESHEEEISSIHIYKNDNKNTTLLDAQSEIESLSEVVIALSPIAKEQEVSGHISETSVHVTHTTEDEENCAMQETAPNNSVTDLVSSEGEFNEFEGFYIEVEPDISMYDFMKRIILYTNLSPSSVIIGCIYIDRLLCSYEPLMINKLNVHMLLMSAIRVASKAYDIRIVGTVDFARAINVDEDDLVELEELMIERLHFNLYVAAEEFNKYAFHLIHAAAGDSLTHALELWSSMYYNESEECKYEHPWKQKQEQEEEKEMNIKSKGLSINYNKLWCWESFHRPKLRMINNISCDINHHHHRHHIGKEEKDAKVSFLLKELEKLSTLHWHNELGSAFSTERAKLANSQTLSKLLLPLPYSLLPPQQPASNMSLSHLWPNSSIAWSDYDKSIECCNISSSNGLSYSALANALRASSSTETSMSVSKNNENNKNNNNNINIINFNVDGNADMKDAVEMLTRELINNENATRREEEAIHVHSLHANALLQSQPIYFTLPKNKLASLKEIEIVTKYISCYKNTSAPKTIKSCDHSTKDVETKKMKEICIDSKVETKEKSLDKTEKEQARRNIREKLRLPNATSPIKCTSPSLSSSTLPVKRPPSSSSHTEKKKKKKEKEIINETPPEGKGSRVRKEATLHNARHVKEPKNSNHIILPAIVVHGVPQPLHDSSQTSLVNSHSLVFAGPTRPRANTIDTIESALPCISNGNTSTTKTDDTNNNSSSSNRKNIVASSLILDKQTMPQAQQKTKYENLYDKYNKTRKIANLNTRKDEQYTEKNRVRKNHLPPLATRTKAGQYI